MLTSCSPVKDSAEPVSNIETSETILDDSQDRELEHYLSRVTVLDVRNIMDWLSTKMEDSVNLPLEDPNFEEKLNQLPKSAEYFLVADNIEDLDFVSDLMEANNFTSYRGSISLEEASEELGIQILND